MNGFTDVMAANIYMAIQLMSANPMYVVEPSIVDVDETFCMAQNLWFEARSSGVNDQRMVAHVTMNRVKDSRYPDSVCGVIWQDKQYSWTHDGKSDQIELDTDDRRSKWSKIVEVSIAVISGNEGDFTDGATHYHAHYVQPGWDYSKLETLGQTNAHKYYRYINGEQFVIDIDEELPEDIIEAQKKRQRLRDIIMAIELSEQVLPQPELVNFSDEAPIFTFETVATANVEYRMMDGHNMRYYIGRYR